LNLAKCCAGVVSDGRVQNLVMPKGVEYWSYS
jgi:hypothetical protein